MTAYNKNTKPRGRAAICQDPNKIDKAGRTKIFSMTTSGNLEKVKDLVKRGAHVNHRDNAGWVPLHEAAIKGQYEIAQFLINSGAHVNVRGFEDDTPLHDAASSGYADCVQLLIDRGANVYALNSDKKTPLDLCDDDECMKILKKRMDELDRLASIDSDGRSLLHHACIHGHIQKAKTLCQHGSNTNSQDKRGYTPSHYAAQYGHLSLLKLLLENGSDINIFDLENNKSVLHVACDHSHEAIVQYLIEMGADINVRDKKGDTPYQSTPSIAVRQIITARMDEERKQRATTEAIDEITFVSNSKKRRKTSNRSLQSDESSLLSREERKIQAIMKAFEKVEKKVNKKKEPPIKKVKEVKKVDTIKLDPHKKDTSGRTQLHKWSIRGNIEVIASLLKAGANPCERDNAGYTPLHEAAVRGKADVVSLLLQNKADVNSRGADQDTPLHDAAENGYTEVTSLLLKYGADVHIKNSKGQTPLDIAVENENIEIQNMLRKAQCTELESPTSPLFNLSGVRDAKAHARQLSGQHLPKKSLKNLQQHKIENIPADGPHTPIPTPPPERWHKKDFHYPSLHSASRFLPLYTIQLMENHYVVVDLQISLLLGISVDELRIRYPHLSHRRISSHEKERLWSPLSSMICYYHPEDEREIQKQQFFETDHYFIHLDQMVSMIKLDYTHLSDSLITITLDMSYPVDNRDKHVKLPPKFAMKMRKCGLLKFDKK